MKVKKQTTETLRKVEKALSGAMYEEILNSKKENERLERVRKELKRRGES